MKSHMAWPKETDQFRKIISTWNIVLLLVVYVALVAATACVLGLIEAALQATAGLGGVTASDIPTRMLGHFMLLVGQDWPAPAGSAPHWSVLTFTGAVGLLLPALLLGAVIFRVLAPRSKLVHFEPRLYIRNAAEGDQPEGGQDLVTTFHIRSRIPCFHVRTQTFIKYFKRFHENPADPENPTIEPFPWFADDFPGKERDGWFLPAPYALIPTQVRFPVCVVRGRDAFEERIAQRKAEQTAAEAAGAPPPDWAPLLLVQDGRVTEAFLDRHRLHRDGPFDQEYLDFMVIVTGEMPDAQATLAEMHRYDVFRDFRDGEDQSRNFEVDYDRRSDRYRVASIGARQEQNALREKIRKRRRRT